MNVFQSRLSFGVKGRRIAEVFDLLPVYGTRTPTCHEFVRFVRWHRLVDAVRCCNTMKERHKAKKRDGSRIYIYRGVRFPVGRFLFFTGEF